MPVTTVGLSHIDIIPRIFGRLTTIQKVEVTNAVIVQPPPEVSVMNVTNAQEIDLLMAVLRKSPGIADRSCCLMHI